MGNPTLRRKNINRIRASVERNRVVRDAVATEYGMSDKDWANTSKFRSARAIVCYIAHKHYGASFAACAVLCGYGHETSAHRSYGSVERSPERLLMAKHILAKIKGVRVA